jgi:hypothetical protein
LKLVIYLERDDDDDDFDDLCDGVVVDVNDIYKTFLIS